MADMTAMPAAPAARTTEALAGLMPPMAMTGRWMLRARAPKVSSPMGARMPVLEGVEKTGPRMA